jgi:phosphoribosylaminoimidazole-succinocarboxamide synthase
MIVIDGNDGVGKTTLCQSLRELGFVVADRGLPTKATDTPELTQDPEDTYVILDAPVEQYYQRLLRAQKDMSERWHTIDALTHYRTRFREVANWWGVPLINAAGTKEETLALVLGYLQGTRKHPPNIHTMTDAQFQKLPLVVEGESKIVRDAGGGRAIIQFKPTVFSFTYNRTGIIPGSDALRLRATKVFTRVLRDAGIAHAYEVITNRFVLSKLIAQPPPIEVIIKANHSGTSRHRYVGMTARPTRTGWTFEAEGRYPAPFIRFDWRNPLIHPDIPGKMLCDEVLGDEMANWFIDVAEARKTAKAAYKALTEFLLPRGIVLYDLCLFLTENGEMIYGEVSPDCGRFRRAEDSSSLDKDVWRAGGSSEHVLEKWAALVDAIER